MRTQRGTRRPAAAHTSVDLPYGLLQYDVVDSSQIKGARRLRADAKDELFEAIRNVVALHGGAVVARLGDGAIFALPAHELSASPTDRLVVAAVQVLRAVEFLNERWNPTIQLDDPLVVRVSCHAGNLVVSARDLSTASGEELDWLAKNERAISRPGAVVITAPVYNNIEHRMLRAIFTILEKDDINKGPHVQLYVYPQEAASSEPVSMRLTWQQYHEAVSELARRLSLEPGIGGFRPDLIIAISRGGAVAGDLLSRLLGNVPFVTLWADRDYDADPRQVRYGGPANPYNDCNIGRLVQRQGIRKILLVDDFCKRGNSLGGALQFVKGHLGKLPVKERRLVKVKTAVLTKEAKADGVRKVKLDFCIHDNKEMLPYGRG